MAERIATIPILPVEILLDIIKSVRNSSLLQNVSHWLKYLVNTTPPPAHPS